MASALEEGSSGDFMVLDSTTSHRLEGTGQLETNMEELIRQREEAILKLCSMCGQDDDGKNRRPFRIVIVGKHGAGKSSFINGVAAALSEDSWHEHAYTGYMGGGAPITIVNQRHVKCCNGDRERYANVLLPTIIDVAGLSDEADEKLEELLRLLFYGHIEEDEALSKVYEDCQKSTKDEIRTQYAQSFPEMRVDRVIFVASAEDTLPERLMKCVHHAARPSHHRTERRAVPIYGVLTKKDKVDVRSVKYLEKKKTFMQGLGLNHSRFLQCSNYCDDLDPQALRTEQLRPELDVPLLRFMQQVCDRALKVVKEDEALPGSQMKTREDLQNDANVERQEAQRGDQIITILAQSWRNLDPIVQDAVTSAVVGMLTLLILYLVVPSYGQGNRALSEACQTHAIRDPTYKDLLCNAEGSAWDQFKQRVGQMVLAAVIGVAFFFYRYISKRL